MSVIREFRFTRRSLYSSGTFNLMSTVFRDQMDHLVQGEGHREVRQGVLQPRKQLRVPQGICQEIWCALWHGRQLQSENLTTCSFSGREPTFWEFARAIIDERWSGNHWDPGSLSLTAHVNRTCLRRLVLCCVNAVSDHAICKTTLSGHLWIRLSQ